MGFQSNLRRQNCGHPTGKDNPLQVAPLRIANDSDSAFQVDNVAAWTSPLTSSEKTPEGIRIGDPSTEGGSGRFYHADWQVDPQVGATAETRLKVVSCSAPWGVVLLVSDGVHEEGVTFFPHRPRGRGGLGGLPADERPVNRSRKGGMPTEPLDRPGLPG